MGQGTFDFVQLARDLRTKSSPQGTEPPSGIPVGSVSLPAGQDLRLIRDEAFVKSLLQAAWNARLPASATREIEDERWVGQACSLR